MFFLIPASVFFHILVVAPLFLLAGNAGRSALAVEDVILGWPLAAAVVCSLLSAAVFAGLDKRGHSWPLALLCGLGLYLVCAFYFLGFNLELLDGSIPDFAALWPGGVLEMIVIGALLTLAILRPKFLLGLPSRLLVILILAQAALVAWSIISSSHSAESLMPTDAKFDPATTDFFRDAVLSPPITLGEKNAIVILVDTLQSDIFHQVVNSHPDLQDAFRDFTLYANAAGLFPFTGLSVPAILSGEAYEPDAEAIPEYSARAADKQLASLFAEAGMGVGRIPLHNRADYLMSEGERCRAYAEIFDVYLFRQVPALLKSAVFDEGRMQLSRRCSNLVPETRSEQDVAVLEKLVSETRRDDDKGMQFVFLHLWGAHPPAILDERCNLVEPSPQLENLQAQSTCIVGQIANYLNKIRDLGVFETSLVVIVADHGARDRFIEHDTVPSQVAEFIRSAAYPTIAVHFPGDQNSFRIDQSPVTLLDIYPSILREFDITTEMAGIDLRDARKFPDRERQFIYFKTAREFYQERLDAFERFMIAGHVRDPSAWYRLAGPHTEAPLDLVDLGTNEASIHLGIGWSGGVPSEAWWTIDSPASVSGRLPASDTLDITIRLRSPHASQQVTLAIDGEAIGSFELDRARSAEDWVEHTVRYHPREPATITALDVLTSINRPVSLRDTRRHGVFVDWIKFEAVGN